MRARLFLLAALVAAATAMVWTCGHEGPTSGDGEARTAERTVAPEALAPRPPPETGLAVAPRTIEPDRPPTPTSGRLVGTVVDEAGRPIEGALVIDLEVPSEMRRRFRLGGATTDEQGRFALSGVGGSPAHLLVHDLGRTPAEWRGLDPYNEGMVLPPVVLRLGATISGQVAGKSQFVRVAWLGPIGAHDPEGIVDREGLLGGASVRRTPAGPITVERIVAVAEDGTFVVTGLAEGPYRVDDWTDAYDVEIDGSLEFTHPDVAESQTRIVRAPAADVRLDVRTARWQFGFAEDKSPTLVTITSSVGRAVFRADPWRSVQLEVRPQQEYTVRFAEPGLDPVETIRRSPDADSSASIVVPRSIPDRESGSTPTRGSLGDWDNSLHLELVVSDGRCLPVPVRLTRPGGYDEPVVTAVPGMYSLWSQYARLESFRPRLWSGRTTELRTPLEAGRYVLHILDPELEPATIPFDVMRAAGDPAPRLHVTLRPR